MTKIAGSGSRSESGSISQRHGSPDTKCHGSGTMVIKRWGGVFRDRKGKLGSGCNVIESAALVLVLYLLAGIFILALTGAQIWLKRV
jgi:hypothetical protein